MKSIKIIAYCLIVFLFDGCYTVLMKPSDFINSHQEEELVSHRSYGSDIDYNQSCISCHSQAELDDRYFDMRTLGITNVHGISMDPYGWSNPSIGVPWWQVPVTVSTATGAIPSDANKGEERHTRRRTVGSTRGEEDRRGVETSTNVSAQTSSSSTITTNNSSESGVTVSTVTSSASSQATTTPQGKGEDTNSQKRKSGSTRGDK